MGLRPGKLVNFFSSVSNTTASSPSPTFSQTKLITEYGRIGELANAIAVFEQMPQRNQVSYNAMLSVLLDSGQLDSALRLFDKMPEKNARTYTSMIAGLSRSGHVSKACHLFHSIPTHIQNVFTWTAMMSCHVHNDEPLEALKLFSGFYAEFFLRRILPNRHSFSVLLKCCGCLRSNVAARQIQSLIVKLLDVGSKDSVVVQNALIDVYAKFGNLVDAKMIFDRMKWKDLGSWNTLMDGYAHHLLLDEALSIFNLMSQKDVLSWNIMMSGLLEGRRGAEAISLFLSLLRSEESTKPTSSTHTIVLTSCATLALLEFGIQIHTTLVKNGYCSNVFVCNSLLTMYANCGLVDELTHVFDEMPKKDVVSWNSAIQGLGQNGLGQKALEVAQNALDSNNFNQNTFSAILTTCSHGGFVVEGLSFFNSMRNKYGIEPSLDHYICAVDMLGRAGKLKEAHDLLRSMPFAANCVAWAALLSASVIHGDVDMGRVAAGELRELEPGNPRSYLGLANIYSRAGRIEESSRKLLDCKDLVKELGSSWVIHHA